MEVVKEEQRGAGKGLLERDRCLIDVAPTIGERRHRPPERRTQAAEELIGSSVAAFHGVVGHGHAAGSGELGEERRLARAGGSDDDAEALLPERRQQLEQAFTLERAHLRHPRAGEWKTWRGGGCGAALKFRHRACSDGYANSRQFGLQESTRRR